MNRYNPDIHHRRSIRLKGYDYAQAGLYFITICCENREHRFGKIENGEMILNDAGKMIEKWYYEIENKFPDMKCHEMMVMPNHFHCIIQNVGADLRVCPVCHSRHAYKICPVCHSDHNGNKINHTNDINMGENTDSEKLDLEKLPMGEHTGSPQQAGSPLHRVVQWFKTMSTNEYIRGIKTLGWPPFHGRIWQRNYYEHIIRNEHSYQRISEYIVTNPARWAEDKFYSL